MSIRVSANTTGLESYIGGVLGYMEALGAPEAQDGFIEHAQKEVKSRFMIETIASHEAGNPMIKHMFEWGSASGETSSIPLFKLTSTQSGKTRILGFDFLPSVRPVPLPGPEYGIEPDVMSKLNPQIFPMKALVMETRSTVISLPRRARRLFIPSMENDRGFVMASASAFNPGGSQATGGFTRWWNMWFASQAEFIVNAEAKKLEEVLGNTGRRVVRWAAGTVIGGKKVGGQFTYNQGLNYAVVKGAEGKWRADTARILNDFYGGGY